MRGVSASAVLRGIGVAVLLLLALPLASALRFVPLPGVRRAWILLMLRVLGVRVRVSGTPAAVPALLAANHVSWLDILALGQCSDAGFVAKSEVRKWPLIGWLAESVGTEFIVRGGGGVAVLARRLANRLKDGASICLFPEGTTTAGYAPGRFYPQLLAAAEQTQVPVQPVALRYSGLGAHAAPFIGDDEFVSHLWRLLCAGSIEAELVFLPAIRNCDARTTASLAREAIAAVLRKRLGQAVAGSVPDTRPASVSGPGTSS